VQKRENVETPREDDDVFFATDFVASGRSDTVMIVCIIIYYSEYDEKKTDRYIIFIILYHV